MTLSIGSISHGTLRSEDLASALCDTLLSLEYNASDSIIGNLQAIADGEEYDSDWDSEVISEAIDILQLYAPPFCYVGFHDGDASDLGVWPCFESIETAIHDGEAIRIQDLADLDSAELNGKRFAILTNCHGNVSVYRLSIAATQVWDCV